MTAPTWFSLYPKMPERVARWFYTSRDYPHARVPKAIEWEFNKWLTQIERGDQVKEVAGADALDNARELAADEIRQRCPGMEKRREAERRLAARMLMLKDGPSRIIRIQAEKMLLCRQHGFFYRQDGNSRIAWSDKCGCTRLCPDESRAETQRLVDRYVSEILRWTALKPFRDVHYCVFTVPNVPVGKLLEGKRALMDRQREFLRELRLEGKICGALVVQEDPLGRSPGFNVHNNVLLLCDQWLDYEEVRRRWGFNVEMQLVDPTEKKLTWSILELVKYAAKHISDKDDDVPEGGWLFPEYQKAPPLVEWPDEALSEWLTVQLGDQGEKRRAPFRRVRSYGCLYRLEALRWRDAGHSTRLDWSTAAAQFDALEANPRKVARELSWYALDKRHGEGTRDAIRSVWGAVDGKDDSKPTDPIYLGVVKLAPDGRYWVGSIQGNNFFDGGGVISGVGKTGPPKRDN